MGLSLYIYATMAAVKGNRIEVTSLSILFYSAFVLVLFFIVTLAY